MGKVMIILRNEFLKTKTQNMFQDILPKLWKRIRPAI
jgi:hypothetical protein